MYAILKTRIEYDPNEPGFDNTDYHDILPEVFDHMGEAIAYIDAQITKDEAEHPEYIQPVEGEQATLTYEVNKHKIKKTTGEWVYLVAHKTYKTDSHRHLCRWLEYEVFPVIKKKHNFQ